MKPKQCIFGIAQDVLVPNRRSEIREVYVALPWMPRQAEQDWLKPTAYVATCQPREPGDKAGT